MIVKVCGVRTPDIAEVAVDAGADWIGVVFVPGSPRHADDQAAARVRDAVRGRAGLVGVFVGATAAECDAAARRYRLAAVQVHGDASPSLVARCSVPVIRAINAHSAQAALTDSWWADCLVLLDAAPETPGGLPGGTGTRVDEGTAAALARHRRLILAGGLTPHNVAGAITAVRPHGVDASSGLESAPGVKDPGLVAGFVATARAAEAAAQPAAPR